MIDENTIIFRLAGDEFGVFRMGLQDRSEIEQMIQEMKKEIRAKVTINKEICISLIFSAGASIYNSDATDFLTLLEYADFAMYQAKRSKNDSSVIEFFDRDAYEVYRKAILNDNRLDVVLENKEVYAVYQPIFYLDSGELYGYEGLSRTNNPAFSNIVELIETAKRRDKLFELDLLMTEQVIRGFNKEGKLFVNIEGKSIDSMVKYMEKIDQIVMEVGIPTEDIVLELSERTKWDEESLELIRHYLKKYKYILAIDDFGVGYSNTSLLLEIHPDIIKIDRSFIQRIHEDPSKYSYIKTFLEFARENNIKTVSEGIEVEEELEVLRNLGSSFGQGFYLGKPE